LVVKRLGCWAPLASERLPLSLRLSPKTTILWTSVVPAWAATLKTRAATMAPLRRRKRGMDVPLRKNVDRSCHQTIRRRMWQCGAWPCALRSTGGQPGTDKGARYSAVMVRNAPQPVDPPLAGLIQWLRARRQVVVITGAGVSTASG